jgi:hypothetical protein
MLRTGTPDQEGVEDMKELGDVVNRNRRKEGIQR